MVKSIPIHYKEPVRRKRKQVLRFMSETCFLYRILPASAATAAEAAAGEASTGKSAAAKTAAKAPTAGSALRCRNVCSRS